MKIKITKKGQPCRYCGTPVVKKLSEFKLKKLKRKYFYTAYFYCKKCKIYYLHDKFKITPEDWRQITNN